MIVRILRGLIRPGQEESFHRFIREVGVPTVESNPHCSAVHVGRRSTERGAEFAIVTVWDDWDAILEGSAGHPDETFFRDQMRPFLHESWVEHYEALDASGREPTLA